MFKKLLSKGMAASTQVFGVNGSGISSETVEMEANGYYEAMTYLFEVFQYMPWHNAELDEEDLPEANELILIAYRDTAKKKGYGYRIGYYDDTVVGWKLLKYEDTSINEESVDDDFLKNRLIALKEEHENILDFAPVRAAYIEGFNHALIKMRQNLNSYRWRSMEKADEYLSSMQKNVLTVFRNSNEEDVFNIVEYTELFYVDSKQKYTAWANIEPFINALDLV